MKIHVFIERSYEILSKIELIFLRVLRSTMEKQWQKLLTLAMYRTFMAAVNEDDDCLFDSKASNHFEKSEESLTHSRSF